VLTWPRRSWPSSSASAVVCIGAYGEAQHVGPRVVANRVKGAPSSSDAVKVQGGRDRPRLAYQWPLEDPAPGATIVVLPLDR
jgi:hypothetical protein